MKRTKQSLERVGTSLGVRLPRPMRESAGLWHRVVLEQRPDGILIRRDPSEPRKLSWKETAEEMARSGESWQEWDALAADGLDDL